MARLPILPQIIGIDNQGTLVSFYDDETDELTLSFYNGPTENDDIMSFSASKLISVTIPNAVIRDLL